jgi:hypothetical protein
LSFLFSGKTGDTGIATYDDALDQYRIVAMRQSQLYIVRVYHSGGPAYLGPVSANADGVHPGRVYEFSSDVATYTGDCWILFADGFDPFVGAVSALNYEFYGPAKRCGLLTSEDTELPLYVLSRGAEELVMFELKETLTFGVNSHAKAELVANGVEIEVYDPYVNGPGMWAGLTGYWGLAQKMGAETYTDTAPVPDETRHKYGIVWMEQIACTIEFTTTEYIGQSTAGRLASCSVDWYDHQGKNPGSTVDVRDPQDAFPDVISGAKGEAKYDYHNGYYRITRCQRAVNQALALLDGASCGSTITIDNFIPKPYGEYVLSDGISPTSAGNPCDQAGLDNDTVIIRRTSDTPPHFSWEVVQIELHEAVVLTGVTVVGLPGAQELKQFYRTIYTQMCDETISQATIIPLVDCSDD